MRLSKIIATVFAVFAILFPFFNLIGGEVSHYEYVSPTFLIAAVFFWFGYCGVPQSTLLGIIEKQINNDPNAIEYIAKNDT